MARIGRRNGTLPRGADGTGCCKGKEGMQCRQLRETLWNSVEPRENLTAARRTGHNGVAMWQLRQVSFGGATSQSFLVWQLRLLRSAGN
ncbi:MAG TPA: hypothetical protein DCY79_10585 [Planctomycetaceae bacterium]|nr:hypothetical protein [Blastopirellula sp.]HAY80240.1 hypothetical protein [Planctomycetaceae bacterium]